MRWKKFKGATEIYFVFNLINHNLWSFFLNSLTLVIAMIVIFICMFKYLQLHC